MKKLFVIVLIVSLILTLTACGASIERDQVEGEDSMFVIVEQTNGWLVVYQRNTMVMYAISCGGYNSGNFCLLVNPDGTPMLWRGR
jgi:hypothetical protein